MRGVNPVVQGSNPVEGGIGELIPSPPVPYEELILWGDLTPWENLIPQAKGISTLISVLEFNNCSSPIL